MSELEQSIFRDKLRERIINLRGKSQKNGSRVVLESFMPLQIAIDRITDVNMTLIKKRNKIIDSPLKLFFLYYKKRLAHIDNQIDKLDVAIYELAKVVRDLKIEKVVDCE